MELSAGQRASLGTVSRGAFAELVFHLDRGDRHRVAAPLVGKSFLMQQLACEQVAMLLHVAFGLSSQRPMSSSGSQQTPGASSAA